MMSVAKPQAEANVVWNVPNQLSMFRLVLAVLCFALLEFHCYFLGMGAFALAAITDFVDGYWARKYGQITQLGRILDPFADKVLTCGVFVYLAANPSSQIAPWVAVVVISRELLVTALRSFVEEGGGDFSAKWAGKWKMVAQCAAILLSMLWLAADGKTLDTLLFVPTDTYALVLQVTVYVAVFMTLYSGWGYVRGAMVSLRG